MRIGKERERERERAHHGNFVRKRRRHGCCSLTGLVVDTALSVFIHLVVVEDERRGDVGGHLMRSEGREGGGEKRRRGWIGVGMVAPIRRGVTLCCCAFGCVTSILGDCVE